MGTPTSVLVSLDNHLTEVHHMYQVTSNLLDADVAASSLTRQCYICVERNLCGASGTFSVVVNRR